jgi:c-di-GMP-binding flagellar brake protein YcgR
MFRRFTERRKEKRVAVQTPATVTSQTTSRTAQATSLNISQNGVLLRFDHPVSLKRGDKVTCDFLVENGQAEPISYWGIGRIVRVDAGSTAVALEEGGLTQLVPECAPQRAMAAD